MTTKHAIVLLAFNRNKATDLARIATLSKSWDVWTVARDGGTHKQHWSITFNCTKGQEVLCQRLVELVHTTTIPHVVVVLDYFWCANNYYKEQYGTGWLTGWVADILATGVWEVILPYNIEVTKMEREPGALQGVRLIRQSNPLWQATLGTRMISEEHHNSKMVGVDKALPFISFKIAGLSFSRFLLF